MGSGNLEIIKNYLADIGNTLTRLPLEKIAEAIDLLEEVRRRGRKVFIFGNGGSAATASHFAGDLAKGTISKGRPRIRALALTDNVPLLSAWANDSSFENIFAEQLENLVEPGDVVIAISGSGNSPNVLKGVKVARARGATTIGFIGFDGGKLKELVDIPLVVPNNTMEQVEDVHLLLEHLITTCLKTSPQSLIPSPQGTGTSDSRVEER